MDFLWMFTTPHTAVTGVSIALCEVQATRRAQAQSKHNANKKYESWSNPVFVAKDMCVRETVIFSFLLQWKKEKKYFYVIETFLELFLGCFILYVL